MRDHIKPQSDDFGVRTVTWIVFDMFVEYSVLLLELIFGRETILLRRPGECVLQ
jgi:hypothetical protein